MLSQEADCFYKHPGWSLQGESRWSSKASLWRALTSVGVFLPLKGSVGGSTGKHRDPDFSDCPKEPQLVFCRSIAGALPSAHFPTRILSFFSCLGRIVLGSATYDLCITIRLTVLSALFLVQEFFFLFFFFFDAVGLVDQFVLSNRIHSSLNLDFRAVSVRGPVIASRYEFLGGWTRLYSRSWIRT